MEKRPVIELKLTNYDKIFEILGGLFIVTLWIFTILSYESLPQIIPIHFNSAGEADGFGDKWTIITLPIVSTVLFIALSILNKFPQIFNFPTTITVENAHYQYLTATRLIRQLKVVIVIIFGLINFETIQFAKGKSDGLGIWFLPITLLSIFAPIFYYLIKSSKSP